jgi:transcriptional regulator with XRE-family HTH domain
MSADDRLLDEFDRARTKLQGLNDKQIQRLRDNLAFARLKIAPDAKDEKLAGMTGVSQRTITNFFSGAVRPDLQTVLSLTHILGQELRFVAMDPEEFRARFEPETE